MKKVISLILAVMLIATMSITVFADEPQKGSITINGVGASTTYEIYKLLDLESYDADAKAYSYKANAAWAGFLATDAAKVYLATDADGYVTWNTATADDEDTVAAFAKLALAYAKANGIDPVKSSENDGEFVITGTTGKFEDLELGYYLVDSTMGALCGLTTTNPDASINAKNGIPTVDKQVLEDSTSQWGASNTADIGQTVEFRVTINVHAGAENYILHDVMSAGITYGSITKIEHIIPGKETHVMTPDKYEVKTGNAVVTDGCTFEIHFSKEICDKLETNDKIVVTYSAMLNRNAVINGAGNDNSAWLSFGEGGVSNEDTVTTYTYGIDIVKTDSSNKLIDGAQFKIYDAENGGNEVIVVYENGAYYRAADETTGVDIVVANGQVRVVGFDNGTYYIEETVAPDGYNKLTSRQKFIISDGNLDAVFNGGIFSTGSGVHVINKTGNILPETGGMGTTLFVTFGAIVVLFTGVILVTKKRMANIAE